MHNKTNLVEAIAAQKILPLFYHAETDCCLQVVTALYKAGIRVLEFTNRGATAFNTFREIVNMCSVEMPDLYLGVGTIKNAEEAERFIKVGAHFIISPGYVPDLTDYAVRENILYVPGCMTIAEIIAAENAGIRLVKLFPANMLGITFLNNIKPLFPNMLFLPTGGIQTSKESLHCWFDAGVTAVGLGSSLISNQLLDKKGFMAITKATREALDCVQVH